MNREQQGHKKGSSKGMILSDLGMI
jgi:hypothetical protein